MDVRLPNGQVISGVPEGTPREEIMAKAIKAGLASEEDFGGTPAATPQGQTLADVRSQFESLLNEGTFRNDQAAIALAEKGLNQLNEIAKLSPSTTTSQDGDSLNVGNVAGAMFPQFNPELMATVGSSMIAEPVAGLSGIATGLAGGDSQQTSRAVNEVREGLTVQPVTDFGRGGVEALGAAMEPIAEGIDATGTAIGSVAATGVEALGGGDEAQGAAFAAGRTLPDAVLAVSPFKYKGVRDRVSGRSKSAKLELDQQMSRGLDDAGESLDLNQDLLRPTIKESAKKAEIRAAIEAGDKAGAKFQINPKGKIIPDKAASEAIKQGFSDGVVSTVKQSSPADRQAMLRMLDVAEAGFKNPKQRARNRPSDVIGDSVMKRWQAVSSANKKAAADIRKAANRDLKGQEIDVTDAVDAFADDLSDLGIEITDRGLVFKGSQVEGSNVAPLKRVFDRIKTKDDGLELHRLKQYIDAQIDWDRPGNMKPLDQKAVNALKGLRSRVNESLKAASEDYSAANLRASETFDAMGDIMDVMGRRFNPNAENVSSMVGQEMRKVLSNYSKRADMVSAIDKLDEVAGNYGGKFDDDIVNQVVFLNDMERKFGTFADNSFQGGIEKGGRKAAQFVQAGNVEKGAMALEAGADKIRGINEQNAIKAMRQLLRR